MKLKVQTICCDEETDHEIWSDPLCELVLEIVLKLLKNRFEVNLKLSVGKQVVALKVQPVCDIEMYDHVYKVVLWLDSLCKGEQSGSHHSSEGELGMWFKNQLVNEVNDTYLKALQVQLVCDIKANDLEIRLWLDSGSLHRCEAELTSFSVLFMNQNEIDSELGSTPLVALKVQPVSDTEVKDHESVSKCGGTQLVVKSVRDITDSHEKLSDCVLNVEKSSSKSPKRLDSEYGADVNLENAISSSGAWYVDYDKEDNVRLRIPESDRLKLPHLQKATLYSDDIKSPFKIKNFLNVFEPFVFSDYYSFSRRCKRISPRDVFIFTFTVRESVGMHRGAAFPLDFVSRISNSKFWILESDVWADLLIICRWANPTSISKKEVVCVLCDEIWFQPMSTSCGHTFCAQCIVSYFEADEVSHCPKCKHVIDRLIYPSEASNKLLTAYFDGRQVSEDVLIKYTGIGKRRRIINDGDSAPSSKKLKVLPQEDTTYGLQQCGGKKENLISKQKHSQDVSLIPADELPTQCDKLRIQRDYTKDDLLELFEILYPARTVWYNLGLSLGIPVETLEAIEIERRGNCKDCLRESLYRRLQMKPLCLKDLIQALKKPIVGHGTLVNSFFK